MGFDSRFSQTNIYTNLVFKIIAIQFDIRYYKVQCEAPNAWIRRCQLDSMTGIYSKGPLLTSGGRNLADKVIVIGTDWH